jgi:ParB/RepB/Spo0J family partition protein
MAKSLSQNGQLEPIKVRKKEAANPDSPSVEHEKEASYEIVYGHRRYLAAKQLGWKTLRTEIVDSTSDERVILESLIENLEREELSDYEKATIFERLNREFKKSYEEIGALVGISKQHIAGYVAMLRLFGENELSTNRCLRSTLNQLSEHHARILSRVEDQKLRVDLALLTVKENLSVRDLATMVNRFRSWFRVEEKTKEAEEEKTNQGTLFQKPRNTTSDDQQLIRQAVMNDFKFQETQDFESFRENHLFTDGFSLFPSFAPFNRLEEKKALNVLRKVFFKIPAPFKVENLKVKILGDVALCTLNRSDHSKPYSNGKRSEKSVDVSFRGTMVLVKRNGLWKIIHEHWSPSRWEISSVKFKNEDEQMPLVRISK